MECRNHTYVVHICTVWWTHHVYIRNFSKYKTIKKQCTFYIMISECFNYTRDYLGRFRFWVYPRSYCSITKICIFSQINFSVSKNAQICLCRSLKITDYLVALFNPKFVKILQFSENVFLWLFFKHIFGKYNFLIFSCSTSKYAEYTLVSTLLEILNCSTPNCFLSFFFLLENNFVVRKLFTLYLKIFEYFASGTSFEIFYQIPNLFF